MLRIEPKQLSLHYILYNKIPENHMLKKIQSVVDFSFINELLATSYCKHFGRPAKEPELMCKLLILQHLYQLSDERVIEEANLNLAYLYFLRLNPEDKLPDKSLLAKFRCHRLHDVCMDDIMLEVVRQCVQSGIIKGTEVSIDATHIEANTIKKIPERLMKQLAKKIVTVYEKETAQQLTDINESPNYKEIEDHHEAKQVMKHYLDTVIEHVETQPIESAPQTQEMIEQAKRIVNDPLFMQQKGVRSMVDEDARVGRKSKEQSFYGYKAEFIMTTDEQIITAVTVNDGTYVDGTNAKVLLDQTTQTGMTIQSLYGDKGYFRKPILDMIKNIDAKAYIPVSECVYKIDESQYTYNKDADQWICRYGNHTIEKKYYKNKQGNGEREGYRYYFERTTCQRCPYHDECAKKQQRKVLSVGLNTPEFYSIAQEQKEAHFKEQYKKRASIESKNAELKRFHGLARARGYSLKSVTKQAKLTALAVNLKRIAAIAIA